MTERDMQAIRDDLSYLRALAAEGRTAPFLGGSILLAAGLIFAAAALVHGLAMTGVLRGGPGGPSAVVIGAWIAAGVAFGLSITLIKRRIGSRPGAMTASNRAFGVLWSSLGYGFFAIILAVVVAAWQLGDGQIMGLLCCVIFAMYGAGWAASAQLGTQKWLWIVALGSLASAVGFAFKLDEPDILLWYAAALICWVAIPGAILVRQTPSETV